MAARFSSASSCGFDCARAALVARRTTSKPSRGISRLSISQLPKRAWRAKTKKGAGGAAHSSGRFGARVLVGAHELDAAVGRAAHGGLVRVDGARLAVALRRHAEGLDPLADEVLAHRLGALL